MTLVRIVCAASMTLAALNAPASAENSPAPVATPDEQAAAKARAKDLCEKGVMSAAECVGILGAQTAADAPLCTFAKRILSERPTEFAKFKGAASPHSNTGFEGTAVPDESTKCYLSVRRKLGAGVLKPWYSCSRNDLAPEKAKELYAKYKSELSTCFGAMTASESLPNESDPSLSWSWKVQAVDYSVELVLTNSFDFLAKLIAGKPTTEAKFTVNIIIEDSSPTRPGAVLPEVD